MLYLIFYSTFQLTYVKLAGFIIDIFITDSFLVNPIYHHFILILNILKNLQSTCFSFNLSIKEIIHVPIDWSYPDFDYLYFTKNHLSKD